MSNSTPSHRISVHVWTYLWSTLPEWTGKDRHPEDPSGEVIKNVTHFNKMIIIAAYWQDKVSTWAESIRTSSHFHENKLHWIANVFGTWRNIYCSQLAYKKTGKYVKSLLTDFDCHWALEEAFRDWENDVGWNNFTDFTLLQYIKKNLYLTNAKNVFSVLLSFLSNHQSIKIYLTHI